MRLIGRLLVLIVAFVLSVTFIAPNSVYAESIVTENATNFLQGGASVTARSSVNVRGGPGTGFWIVGVLSANETVPVLGISPDSAWWYVNLSYGAGWVSSNSVNASNTAGVGIHDPGPIVAVSGSQLSVRGGPGEAAILLGRVYYGNQLILLGRSNDGAWLNVRSEFGENTWVAARFTSLGDAAAPSGSTDSVAVTEAETYAFVNAAQLNVRSGPGINYSIVATIVGGERLPIIGRNADRSWYNVQTVYGEGWVSARYVIARNEYGNAPVTSSTVDSSGYTGPTAIINTGALNIRSGDSAVYTVLGTAQGGDRFQILARNSSFSWILIRTADFDGWINRRYVLIQGDTSNLQVANANSASRVTDSSGNTANTTAVLTGPVAFVATGALNVRSGPNIAFDSIGVVMSTTRMPIIGQSADGRWWQVESPFGAGWVNKSLILVEGNATSVPVVQ